MFCRCCGVTCLLLKREFGFETNESSCYKVKPRAQTDDHASTVDAHTKEKEKQLNKLECWVKHCCLLWLIITQMDT